MAPPPPPDSTDVHRGPRRPRQTASRNALVCAFPHPTALTVPDSGAVVGREWLAAAGLTDGKVSGAHVRFDRVGGGLGVTDHGSRNGTWVNGSRLTPKQRVALSEGSVLRLGRTLLVVREALRGALAAADPLGDMVGPYGLREVAHTIAGLTRQTVDTILIEGETGVGKELAARVMAQRLGRDEPYGPVNIAGVADGVFEAQLFGHVAGAYSGAGEASAGIVMAHDGGTVFLDEIGELSLPLQTKLLRLLDNREVLPVGAARPLHADVLIVAASNHPLDELVKAGGFRADLYARLAQARLLLPPLRERAEDVYPIALRFMADSGAPLDPKHVEVEAVERLLLEPWPRNIRQLHAALLAAKRADPEPGLSLWSLEKALGQLTHNRPVLSPELVEATIADTDGNVSEAAKRLGVSRGKLLRFRQRHRDQAQRKPIL